MPEGYMCLFSRIGYWVIIRRPLPSKQKVTHQWFDQEVEVRSVNDVTELSFRFALYPVSVFPVVRQADGWYQPVDLTPQCDVFLRIDGKAVYAFCEEPQVRRICMDMLTCRFDAVINGLMVPV